MNGEHPGISHIIALACPARVVRILGVSGVASGTSHAIATAEAYRPETADPRPLTEMIVAVLEEKRADGIGGVEPKDAAKIIRERWKPEVTGTYVSTTFWRMWKRGDLEKDEGGTAYRLPTTKEPAGNVAGEPPAGSLL